MSRVSSKPSFFVLVATLVFFAALTTSKPLQGRYVPAFLPKRQDSNYNAAGSDDPTNSQGGSNVQDSSNAQGGAQESLPGVVPAITGTPTGTPTGSPAYDTGTPYTDSWMHSGSSTPMPTPDGGSFTDSWSATPTSAPATDSYSLPPMTTTSSMSMPASEPTPAMNSSIPMLPHPPVGQGLQQCGAQRYSPTVYTCYDSNVLCPFILGEATKPCGKACYPPSKYECDGDKLKTLKKPGDSTSVNVPPLPTGSDATMSDQEMMAKGSESPSMSYTYPAPAGAPTGSESKLKTTDWYPQVGDHQMASDYSEGQVRKAAKSVNQGSMLAPHRDDGSGNSGYGGGY